MDDIDEACDWLGRDIDCSGCDHRALLKQGLCRLKHACVHDRYARRIDRFFNWNPHLANGYVGHPHFEVRAIAAKHASPSFCRRCWTIRKRPCAGTRRGACPSG